MQRNHGATQTMTTSNTTKHLTLAGILSLGWLLPLTSNAFDGAAPALHQYTVTVSEDLEHMTVEARFDGRVHSVAARSPRAGRYLADFQNCDDDPRLRMRNRRMIVPAGGIRCMSYTVNLRDAASEQRQNQGLNADNIIVSPSLWLWRPEITNTSELLVDFELPPGIDVAVPWQAVDENRKTYHVSKSPENADVAAAFGRFEYHEVAVPGATLRVSLLRGESIVENNELLRWVTAAATDVSLAYGRFPNPSPQVLVIPVAENSRRGGGAVPYGRVVRDGGESVELYVDPAQPLTAFLNDWTATHEFSHLMLPYVNRNHRWISEGFAQYYQNVLLARSGTYNAQHAWQKLYEGYTRGRLSRPELSPNDAAEGGKRDANMKVYWSGAALALMADVALREQSNGEQTLDSVLQQLQTCCLPSDRVWSGPELFATLDDLSGRTVFMPLYRRYADAAGFPDTSPIFAELGLKVDDGQVRLLRDAELMAIRSAITEVDSKTASWRQQLASNVR
ncbi:MAG: hypothetical protein RIA65_07860 [Woeseia sp.]